MELPVVPGRGSYKLNQKMKILKRINIADIKDKIIPWACPDAEDLHNEPTFLRNY
jgi:hypothetical protein